MFCKIYNTVLSSWRSCCCCLVQKFCFAFPSHTIKTDVRAVESKLCVSPFRSPASNSGKSRTRAGKVRVEIRRWVGVGGWLESESIEGCLTRTTTTATTTAAGSFATGGDIMMIFSININQQAAGPAPHLFGSIPYDVWLNSRYTLGSLCGEVPPTTHVCCRT